MKPCLSLFDKFVPRFGPLTLPSPPFPPEDGSAFCVAEGERVKGEGETRRDLQGFTLIEILIVIIILGILASLSIPRLVGKTEEARTQAAYADIEGGLGVALDLYEADMGRYPNSLEDLVQKPGNAERWKGPYLKKRRAPLDPWKNPYSYRYPGTQGLDYDLWSGGPDGIDGSEDDIANWKE